MFGLFKRKSKNSAPRSPELADLNNELLQEGDIVESLRYELGKCKIIKNEEGQLIYESLKSGKQVSYSLMVDASTKLQKVRKLGN
jgi:hypothetical protein